MPEPVDPQQRLLSPRERVADDVYLALLNAADDYADGDLIVGNLNALHAAVLGVRDEEMERLRQRVADLETANAELWRGVERADEGQVRAEGAIERAQALHVEAESNGGPLCEHCTDWAGIAVGYPCPTLRALNGTESSEAAMT